jgi:hypothetical protein
MSNRVHPQPEKGPPNGLTPPSLFFRPAHRRAAGALVDLGLAVNSPLAWLSHFWLGFCKGAACVGFARERARFGCCSSEALEMDKRRKAPARCSSRVIRGSQKAIRPSYDARWCKTPWASTPRPPPPLLPAPGPRTFTAQIGTALTTRGG